jgi:hypothetical protein
LLYQYIPSTRQVSEWFADNVNFEEFFIFGMIQEKARLASKENRRKVKFKWVDEQSKDTEYFLNYF